MAFSNNQTLAAADLNNLADTSTAQTFTAVQTFNGAGNPRVNSSADLSEQSSTPATPASGLARVYVTNDNPPRLMILQDDGDIQIVGGYAWDESRREFVSFDRDTTAIVHDRSWQTVIKDDFFKIRADTTNDVLHTLQGNWKILATGTDAYPVVTGRSHTRVQTGANANDRTALITGVSTSDYGAFRRADQVQLEAIIDVVETSDKVIQFGMAADPSATLNPGTDGIYWEYDSAASANWIGVVRSSSTNTDSDSTVAAAAGQLHLLFIVDGGTDVEFYTRTASTAAWTLRGTNTGTQPGASTDLIPFLKVETLAAAAKNLDIYRCRIAAYLPS